MMYAYINFSVIFIDLCYKTFAHSFYRMANTVHNLYWLTPRDDAQTIMTGEYTYDVYVYVYCVYLRTDLLGPWPRPVPRYMRSRRQHAIEFVGGVVAVGQNPNFKSNPIKFNQN